MNGINDIYYEIDLVTRMSRRNQSNDTIKVKKSLDKVLDFWNIFISDLLNNIFLSWIFSTRCNKRKSNLILFEHSYCILKNTKGSDSHTNSDNLRGLHNNSKLIYDLKNEFYLKERVFQYEFIKFVQYLIISTKQSNKIIEIIDLPELGKL